MVQNFLKAWELQECQACLQQYTQIKHRRVVEQYLFLKYDMSDLKKRRLISKDWGASWFFYLFYDSPLFLDLSISRIYGLPEVPGKSLAIQMVDGIETNLAVWELMVRLYTSNPELHLVENESLINSRDFGLIELLLKGSNCEDLARQLEQLVLSMIEVRYQKYELEGFTEPWLANSASPFEAGYNKGQSRNSLDLSPRTNLFSLNKCRNDEEVESQASELKNPVEQEFMDSDSEADKNRPSYPFTFEIKKQLSKIIEENPDQIIDSNSKNTTEVMQSAAKQDRNPVSHIVFNTRHNTVSAYERGTSDYISSEAAIKNYVQKNSFLKETKRSKNFSRSNFSDGRLSLESLSKKFEEEQTSPKNDIDQLFLSSKKVSSKQVTETE